MQTKAKIGLLALISAAGLLLGGSASADGAVLQSTSAPNISAQIEQIRQKIDQLTLEMQAKSGSQNPTFTANQQLTQAKLDLIEAEVNRIAKETARLKIEVEIFVTLREISAKTAALTAAVAPAKLSATSLPLTPGPIADDAQNRAKIEAQIGQVRQQIAELTQELQAKTAAETSQTGAAEIVIGEDSGNIGQTGQKITIEPAPAKTASQSSPATSNKGFWQSVGDFFKKIFTF